MPDINFKIGNNDFVIPRDMWYERGGNQCVVKFMHSPGKEYWILGLNFFNNYYTVFDYEQMAIGFAESVNFRGAQSKSFITWALSGTALLNLQAKIPETTPATYKVLSVSFVASWLLFAAYYVLVKKNAPKKLQATPVQEREYVALREL